MFGWLRSLFGDKQGEGKQGEKKQIPETNLDDEHRRGMAKTTRRIALYLLYTFIGSLIILFIANLVALFQYPVESTTHVLELEIRKGWFELLKNTLILLGTALTTVIGYYFGQRAGAAQAEQARTMVIEAKKEKENLEQTLSETLDAATEQAAQVIRSTSPQQNDPVATNQAPIAEADDDVEIPQ